MSFISLIFKNPFRNKSRALLAIVGIGIGIATIVALGAITAGLTTTMDETLHAAGSDFSISGKDDTGSTSPFGTATITTDWIDTIKNVDGVKEVAGVYITTTSTPNSPFFIFIGVDQSNVDFTDMKITKGKVFSNNSKEVIIGKLTAENENMTIGDTLTINREEFKITGIFETGDPNQDDGAYSSIETVQNLVNDPDKISMIYVKVDSNVDIEEITERIDKEYGKNITTITSVADVESIATSLDMVNSASWAISLLAIIIGGIGIINTMVMSVYERTREIGVLKAIGWKNRRVLGMILGESIVLTITAGIIGSIVGIIGIELLVSTGALAGIAPVYTIDTFLKAFGIAIIVGLFGGFYPAWRASRLPPTEALRYE